MSEQRFNIPIPDPSVLTNEQFERGQESLRREMGALREYLVSEMRRIEEIRDVKMDGFEIRFNESKAESRTALDAALRAAQNLIDAQNKANAAATEKSESAFTRQIEAVDQQTRTITGALRAQVDDLKERLTGSDHERKGATDNSTKLMAAIILVVTVGMAVFQISSHSQPLPAVVSPAVIPVQPGSK